jgi:small nuclear ribonucleoprotein (snRNP)-like protein
MSCCPDSTRFVITAQPGALSNHIKGMSSSGAGRTGGGRGHRGGGESGGSGRHHRGGGGGRGSAGSGGRGATAPKRESILELAKYMDSVVRVKCIGGRELQGTLRGYDDLVNLVLDDCDEYLRGKSRPFASPTSFVTGCSLAPI